MEILPLAYDSFGVRSMCTLVSFKNLKIMIDPGVALGPTRYGLKPTKEELRALELCKKQVMKISKLTNVAIVTHYHYDHHPYPQDEEMYKECFSNKIVLAKDINKNINFSGKRRGKIFEGKIKNLATSLEYADEREFEFNNVRISFSPAVWHGDVGSKVGRVIMVFIKSGNDSFLFGSDAQSLADPLALKWVKEKNPKFLIVDGYPTIFIGWRLGEKLFEAAKGNLKEAIEAIDANQIILDHHIVRDIEYKERMKDVFEVAKRLNKKINTAAEFLGIEDFFLEAWRKEIYEKKRKIDVDTYFKKFSEKVSLKSG
ncbi:MAG: MBL fold metallo-hydrolase [Candidatus Aenigmarchaeota archaeon]|nr:MBL fold metallo-hydrolase [Candidatus Aenigmarchaeota archaeon]